MRYLSVCSGIEAATVAWHPLGWQAAGFAEIDKFPSAVLAHHYPAVRNFGDFTTIRETDVGAIDLLVGGTPCQSFSVAGLRGGLGDDRGNLALEFCRLALRTRPTWLVWENVPGVLSSNGGRDFGSILGALAECGYGFAYRVLEAQYFGLAQRRKRVFVVGYLGDWRPAAAVLFERESLRGDPAPRRGTGQRVAGTLEARAGTGGYDPDAHGAASGHLIASGIPDISPAMKARDHKGPSSDGDGDGLPLIPMIARSLRGEGFDASEDGTGRGTPLVPVAFGGQMSTPMWDENLSQTLLAQNRQAVAIPSVAFDLRGREGGSQFEGPHDTANIRAASGGSSRSYVAGMAVASREVAGAITSNYGKQLDNSDTNLGPNVAISNMAVRRLTPEECEKLQGFLPGYTAVPYRGKPAADGPRYKALGNSMAVPCMAWIGRRIAMVDALLGEAKP